MFKSSASFKAESHSQADEAWSKLERLADRAVAGRKSSEISPSEELVSSRLTGEPHGDQDAQPMGSASHLGNGIMPDS